MQSHQKTYNFKETIIDSLGFGKWVSAIWTDTTIQYEMTKKIEQFGRKKKMGESGRHPTTLVKEKK